MIKSLSMTAQSRFSSHFSSSPMTASSMCVIELVEELQLVEQRERERVMVLLWLHRACLRVVGETVIHSRLLFVRVVEHPAAFLSRVISSFQLSRELCQIRSTFWRARVSLFSLTVYKQSKKRVSVCHPRVKQVCEFECARRFLRVYL